MTKSQNDDEFGKRIMEKITLLRKLYISQEFTNKSEKGTDDRKIGNEDMVLNERDLVYFQIENWMCWSEPVKFFVEKGNAI